MMVNFLHAPGSLLIGIFNYRFEQSDIFNFDDSGDVVGSAGYAQDVKIFPSANAFYGVAFEPCVVDFAFRFFFLWIAQVLFCQLSPS